MYRRGIGMFNQLQIIRSIFHDPVIRKSNPDPISAFFISQDILDIADVPVADLIFIPVLQYPVPGAVKGLSGTDLFLSCSGRIHQFP